MYKHEEDEKFENIMCNNNKLKNKKSLCSDMLCFSHLRWDFVFQRPQHLLTRCANHQRVFFIEEPVFADSIIPHLDISKRENGLYVVVPVFPDGYTPALMEIAQKSLIDDLIKEYNIKDYILWYYTPMALGFSRHLRPTVTVYDCMDELSAFKGAPQSLRDREAELFSIADVVFTGGQSLYEFKKNNHQNIHPFPSSIDAVHFKKARVLTVDPSDQADIPHPRIGFFGVVDERFDIDLISVVAKQRPDWHLMIIGPVVKIDPTILPRDENIHYLGGKKYDELPGYLAGWDVTMMPFALNESTRFISPTKTPEYLAAGKPVVSTSIHDVVKPYGESKLVHIADTPDAFINAIESILHSDINSSDWQQRVDNFLSNNSWDITWMRMMELIQNAMRPQIYISKQEYEKQSAHSVVIDTAAA
ncbi:MAG: glycosyltransferase family 1 protein [Armatimonadota bacterium]